MKLTNQVCDPEQAVQLKALGIEQLSLFYWTDDTTPEVVYIPKHINHPGFFSAFTGAELSVMLPEFIICSKIKAGIILSKLEYANPYWCRHTTEERSTDQEKYGHSIGPSEAYAKADMLLYMINNQLITIQEINKRLLEAAKA